MSYYTDPQEQGQNQLVASRTLESGCEKAHSLRATYGSDPSVQAAAMLASPEETTCYMCWTIGSAFEDGLSQLGQAGESDGLQAAILLIVQTYLGRNRDLAGRLLSFPSGKAILTLLDSTESIFRYEVWLDSWHILQLTLQRYAAVHPLVQDILRDGQQIDMASYITATLSYYEQHGSPCNDWKQREALMHNSYPTPIILHDQCAAFILIGHDERGRSRLGTNTRMFQEELAAVEKFGPPYYRLRASFLFSDHEADQYSEGVRKALEEIPLFHAGVVMALGKKGAAEATY